MNRGGFIHSCNTIVCEILERQFIWLGFLVPIFTACWPTKDLKHLDLYGETKGVDSNVLDISGVWHITITDSTFFNEPTINAFALYTDGTYLDLGSANRSGDLDRDIATLPLGFERADMKNELAHWGVFKIIGDTVLIQSYLTWRKRREGQSRTAIW
jgi:hypothetical protein